MEQTNSTGRGYKILSIILIVVLAGLLVGAFIYWKDLDNTQKEQQAQIDSLNQQLVESKSSLSEQVQSSKDQLNQELEQRNAELQQKLDELLNGSDESGSDSSGDTAE